MVTINIAYTSPINPSSASPVLTLPQVWAGLERKVRAGQDFVGAIVSTDVIGEKLDQQKGCMVVTREVVFKERPGEKVREVCWLRSMSKVWVFCGFYTLVFLHEVTDELRWGVCRSIFTRRMARRFRIS